MKNRMDKEFIRVFQDLHGHLITSCLNPNYIILDNGASPAFQDIRKEKCIDYQLDPPGIHIINAEERVISTSKDQFIAGIYAIDPWFPMNTWDRLLEQAKIALNLPCPSILNPRLSAYAQLNGELYFKPTPMAPGGKIILVHYRTHNRGKWALHRHKAWYVIPDILYYCLY